MIITPILYCSSSPKAKGLQLRLWVCFSSRGWSPLALVIMLYCIFPAWLSAQISGHILDGNEQPVAYANILLLSERDSTFVVGTSSDSEGYYELALPMPGRYFLRYTSIGYLRQDAPAFLLGEGEGKREISAMNLLEDVHQLEVMEVKAKRLPLRQSAEGVIVDLAASPLNQGTSLLSVLERSPGVFIDRRNGGIALNGRSGVIVLIDGRRQRLPLAGLLALLEGMEAGQVASLELLDTPGAKYDAEGTAGLINIVTRQPEDAGTAGAVLLNAGYGLREKAGGTLRLSHGKGGHYFSGSYGFRHDRTGFRLNGPGLLRLPLLGDGLVQTDYHNRNRGRLQAHNLQFDWEMKLPDSWRFGGAFSGQLTRNRHRIKISNSYLYPADSSFTAAIDILNPNRSSIYQPSLFLERNLPTGGILSFKADYLGFRRENQTEVQNEVVGAEPEDNPAFSPQSRGLGTTQVSVIALQADVEGGKERKVGWAVGLKYSGSEANNSSQLSRLITGQWEVEPRSLNELTSREQLAAGYASLGWRPGEGWQLDLAGRYEYWQQSFSDATPDRSRGRLFPTASASYRFSDTRALHLGYVRRIDRPAFEDLANNLTFSGLVSFFTGNPRLQPTLSDRISLRYQHSPLQFSLAWQSERFPIARFQIVEDLAGGFLLVTPQNVDYQRSLEGQVSGVFELTDWWSVNANLNVANRHFRVSHTPEARQKTYWNATMNGGNTFSLPQEWSLEVSAWYNSGFYVGSTRYTGFGAINLGAKKNLNDGGSIQLAVEDVLGTQIIQSTIGSLTREAFELTSDVYYRPESTIRPVVRFTYLKSFGMAGKAARPERRSAEEERARLGGG